MSSGARTNCVTCDCVPPFLGREVLSGIGGCELVGVGGYECMLVRLLLPWSVMLLGGAGSWASILVGGVGFVREENERDASTK
jgi:hypothetical protein